MLLQFSPFFYYSRSFYDDSIAEANKAASTLAWTTHQGPTIR